MKKRDSFITRRLTVVEISIGSDDKDNVHHHHHHHQWQKHRKWRFKSSGIWHYVTGTFCSSTVIFKTTGNTHPATQHHIPEQLKLQKHHCKNIKPGVHSLAEIWKQNVLRTKLGQINVLCLMCTFFRIRCHGCQCADTTHIVSYSTHWRIRQRKTDISCQHDTPAATTSSGRNLLHRYVQPT